MAQQAGDRSKGNAAENVSSPKQCFAGHALASPATSPKSQISKELIPNPDGGNRVVDRSPRTSPQSMERLAPLANFPSATDPAMVCVNILPHQDDAALCAGDLSAVQNHCEQPETCLPDAETSTYDGVQPMMDFMSARDCSGPAAVWGTEHH